MDNTRQPDDVLDIDERYQLCQSDINLEDNFQAFGTRRLNVAVVGVGRMGAIHLYNVLKETRANLLYILDSDQKRLDFFDRKYFLSERDIKAIHIDKWDEILRDESLEAVLIATPTNMHEHYVRTALESGKHVLCEKPLSKNPEQVDQLVRLAKSKGLKLVCAFQRRHDPSFARMAKQIRRGDIGEIRLIKTCSRDSPTPPVAYIKISGGIYHDCFVHDLDVIVWLAQQLPCEVHAYGHAYSEDYRGLGDHDTAVVCMKFSSGLVSVTDLSRVGPAGYEQRVEVFGPRGILKVDEMARVGWEKHTAMGVVRPSQCYSFASRYIEAYSNELIDFFNHVEGNRTLQPIQIGLLQALSKILNAVEQSAHSAQAVPLEWSEQELIEALGERKEDVE